MDMAMANLVVPVDMYYLNKRLGLTQHHIHVILYHLLSSNNDVRLQSVSVSPPC